LYLLLFVRPSRLFGMTIIQAENGLQTLPGIFAMDAAEAAFPPSDGSGDAAEQTQ
jgi:hypothetical protein